jgi:hypothetical protein
MHPVSCDKSCRLKVWGLLVISLAGSILPTNPSMATPPDEPPRPPSLDTSGTAKPKRQPQVTIQPRGALGFGFNIPELLPIEAYLFTHHGISWRLFAVWPLPFNVRVEYARSVLATEGGLSVENPNLNIDFDGRYGPQFGLEALFHPFDDSFYTSIGLSYRELHLAGDLLSNVILTSSAGSAELNSLISLQAEARTRQVAARASMGWLWPISEHNAYCNLNLLGAVIPIGYTFSQVSMQADIVNPVATVDVKNATIEEAERSFADDLARQAEDSLEPLESLVLPIIGISGGIYF